MKARLRPAELRGVRKGKGAAMGALVKLFAEAELGDQVAVAGNVFALEIIKQRTALVDHHEQAAALMIVLRVGLEMVGKRLDAAREDRDLDFGRTRVAFGAAMDLDQFGLLFSGNRHRHTPKIKC